MPLEISEIGVRVAVQDVAGGPSDPDGDTGDDRAATLSPGQMSDIVARCVKDVLRTLRMLEAR